MVKIKGNGTQGSPKSSFSLTYNCARAKRVAEATEARSQWYFVFAVLTRGENAVGEPPSSLTDGAFIAVQTSSQEEHR